MVAFIYFGTFFLPLQINRLYINKEIYKGNSEISNGHLVLVSCSTVSVINTQNGKWRIRGDIPVNKNGFRVFYHIEDMTNTKISKNYHDMEK